MQRRMNISTSAAFLVVKIRGERVREHSRQDQTFRSVSRATTMKVLFLEAVCAAVFMSIVMLPLRFTVENYLEKSTSGSIRPTPSAVAVGCSMLDRFHCSERGLSQGMPTDGTNQRVGSGLLPFAGITSLVLEALGG